jgi:hypothetical protein
VHGILGKCKKDTNFPDDQYLTRHMDFRRDLPALTSGTYLIQYFTEEKRWGSEKVVLLK